MDEIECVEEEQRWRKSTYIEEVNNTEPEDGIREETIVACAGYTFRKFIRRKEQLEKRAYSR